MTPTPREKCCARCERVEGEGFDTVIDCQEPDCPCHREQESWQPDTQIAFLLGRYSEDRDEGALTKDLLVLITKERTESERRANALTYLIQWLSLNDTLEGSGIRDWKDEDDAIDAILEALTNRTDV